MSDKLLAEERKKKKNNNKNKNNNNNNNNNNKKRSKHNMFPKLRLGDIINTELYLLNNIQVVTPICIVLNTFLYCELIFLYVLCVYLGCVLSIIIHVVPTVHFEQYFSHIVAVSFIGGRNQNTLRKPLTCHKSLTYFIT